MRSPLIDLLHFHDILHRSITTYSARLTKKSRRGSETQVHLTLSQCTAQERPSVLPFRIWHQSSTSCHHSFTHSLSISPPFIFLIFLTLYNANRRGWKSCSPCVPPIHSGSLGDLRWHGGAGRWNHDRSLWEYSVYELADMQVYIRYTLLHTWLPIFTPIGVPCLLLCKTLV